MASAVEKLYPGVQFGFGPAIEHGFYYDFDLPEPLEEKDLARIEKEMRRIAQRVARAGVRGGHARRGAAAARSGQDYKLEAAR